LENILAILLIPLIVSVPLSILLLSKRIQKLMILNSVINEREKELEEATNDMNELHDFVFDLINDYDELLDYLIEDEDIELDEEWIQRIKEIKEQSKERFEKYRKNREGEQRIFKFSLN